MAKEEITAQIKLLEKKVERLREKEKTAERKEKLIGFKLSNDGRV